MSRVHPICANARANPLLLQSAFRSSVFLMSCVRRSNAQVHRLPEMSAFKCSNLECVGRWSGTSGLARRLDNGLREPFGQHYQGDLWEHSAGLFLPIPRIV